MHTHIIHHFHKAHVYRHRAQNLGGTVGRLGDYHASSMRHIVLEASLVRLLHLTMQMRPIGTRIGDQVTRGGKLITTCGAFHDIFDVRSFILRAIIVFRDAPSVTVAPGIDAPLVPSRLDLRSHRVLRLRLQHGGSVIGGNAVPPHEGTFHHHVAIIIGRIQFLGRPAALGPALKKSLGRGIRLATVGAHAVQVLRRDSLPALFQFFAAAGEALETMV
mmetsp:Transcript_43345/g.73948  ORF Transcript_43345/g.73948 Transcript_43345/m.73948 type:complete len:218 (-) Transcript_43345:763-1416(-)